jgi:hypothetical protein
MKLKINKEKQKELAMVHMIENDAPEFKKIKKWAKIFGTYKGEVYTSPRHIGFTDSIAIMMAGFDGTPYIPNGNIFLFPVKWLKDQIEDKVKESHLINLLNAIEKKGLESIK